MASYTVVNILADMGMDKKEDIQVDMGMEKEEDILVDTEVDKVDILMDMEVDILVYSRMEDNTDCKMILLGCGM